MARYGLALCTGDLPFALPFAFPNAALDESRRLPQRRTRRAGWKQDRVHPPQARTNRAVLHQRDVLRPLGGEPESYQWLRRGRGRFRWRRLVRSLLCQHRCAERALPQSRRLEVPERDGNRRRRVRDKLGVERRRVRRRERRWMAGFAGRHARRAQRLFPESRRRPLHQSHHDRRDHGAARDAFGGDVRHRWRRRPRPVSRKLRRELNPAQRRQFLDAHGQRQAGGHRALGEAPEDY